MEKRQRIYEGKAKVLYTTDDPGLLIQHFKDDATAFNAQKRGTIENKGVMNARISAFLFDYLEQRGIKTHYVRLLSDRDMLVKRVEIIPIEVVVRNVVAGSLAQRMGLAEGTPLKRPIVEYYYKSDALGDPMITDEHIEVFDLATREELAAVTRLARTVNEHLSEFFRGRGIRLIDFKLEFGRHSEGLLLADEITPDGCRLWDAATNEKLDKDRFRRDLGGVEGAYERVLRAVTGAA
ncbi:MAG TPA: phosphoribosylaminoimidazolesuccinocarboxamide synthase [Thermodesulfobacteriota bacterium]|nr:phosphoribosylaminoimidazolesuccinocarboxamide synthase [Thermodesulfobacteriota bacterium]